MGNCQLLNKMSIDLMTTHNRLKTLINSAPYRYKIYSIPKKSGKGIRIIAQPSKEIKILQYWVIENILNKFSIHEAAKAYVKGKGILSNSQPHSLNKYLLKIDFKDFFYSIKAKDFISYFSLSKNYGYSEQEVSFLIMILYYCRDENDLCLSIGAPSSPILSNVLMYIFDKILYDYCCEREIVYTRYSDDITISMNDASLRKVVFEKINLILMQIPFPKLSLNEKKTIYLSKANKRLVTGLIIANDGSISIGRLKKRIIRSKIHSFIKGSLDEKEVDQLKGLIAYTNSVEPEFISRLKAKYGDLIIF
jgi:RNA-directed DNA polymerase